MLLAQVRLEEPLVAAHPLLGADREGGQVGGAQHQPAHPGHDGGPEELEGAVVHLVGEGQEAEGQHAHLGPLEEGHACGTFAEVGNSE